MDFCLSSNFFGGKSQTVSFLDIFPPPCRLLQILNHDSGTSKLEPFQTYEALDRAARDLTHNLQLARGSVTSACHEQNYSAARLYSNCETLHRAAYTALQQLTLSPQVRPTAKTDQELLCPNAQVGVFLFIFTIVECN